MAEIRRTDEEVRLAGFAALRQALGREDAVRFLRLYTGSKATIPPNETSSREARRGRSFSASSMLRGSVYPVQHRRSSVADQNDRTAGVGMSLPTRTTEELRAAGFRALVEAVGVADAIRFVRLHCPGEGDYTAEREAMLRNPTVEELLRDLEQWRRQNGPSG